MAINVFVPKFRTEEILEEIKECLDKGWTGLGFKTVQFEDEWKRYTGLPNAHFLNSNTSGLHLAVHVLKHKFNWSDNDEVITTGLTFVSTNHSILYEGLKPVFADVDETLCLDSKDIEKKITDKTRAVMYVGMGGNTGHLDEVVNICKKYNLKLILDAAHMAGTRYKGSHIGKEADVTIFSFQAVKNLPTADAGMICFMDDELDAWVRKLSWLGISKDTYERFNKRKGSYKWYYDVPDVGFKYHGNSIVASIGLVQLKYLDEDNKARNDIADKYDSLLAEEKKIERVPVVGGCYSARHLYQILVEDREKVLNCFYENNIYPGVHYWDNSNYPMYKYAKGTCKNTLRASDRVISLPLHLNLTKQDIYEVVDILKKSI